LKGVKKIEIIIALILFGMLWYFVIGPILKGMGNTVDGLVGFSKGIIGRPDNKKCPICAETIKFEAIVCKHCGYKFPTSENNIKASLEDALPIP
jgi:hypothetical protein